MKGHLIHLVSTANCVSEITWGIEWIHQSESQLNANLVCISLLRGSSSFGPDHHFTLECVNLELVTCLEPFTLCNCCLSL